jgi:hypothetical protein
MKLLKCDGRKLEVFDVGPAIYKLEADRVPIKLHGSFVVDDDVARDWVRQLVDAQKNPTQSPQPKEDEDG